MSHLYILSGHELVECNDVFMWAEWLELARLGDGLRVGSTHVGELWVSTVFLAVDLGGVLNERQILFETLVFDAGMVSQGGRRCYATWAEAERGHQETVAELLTPLPLWAVTAPPVDPLQHVLYSQPGGAQPGKGLALCRN